MKTIKETIELIRGAEANLSSRINTLLDKPLEDLDIDLIGELSRIQQALFEQEMKLIDIHNRAILNEIGGGND